MRFIIYCYNKHTKRGAGLLSIIADDKQAALKMGIEMLAGGAVCELDGVLTFNEYYDRVHEIAVNEYIVTRYNPAMLGNCSRCGKRKRAKGRMRCERCMNKQREYTRKWRPLKTEARK